MAPTRRARRLSLLLVAAGAAGCAHPLPPCGAGPLLVRAPLDESDLVHVVPLGNLNPPGHTHPTDHLYLTVPRVIRDGREVPAVVPVRSPGALRLVLVQRRQWLDGRRRGESEYKINLASCAEVVFTLDHLLALAPGLGERIGGDDRDCEPPRPGAESRLCRRAVDIALLPGEALGFTGGEGQYALDLGARDARIPPLPFANPARHAPGRGTRDDAQAVCALDYLPAAERDRLLLRAGGFSPDDHRVVEPRCGALAQDLAGTAQGLWFRQGAPTLPEAPHLALVHDNVDPSRAVVASGTSLDGLRGAHPFTPRTEGLINRDFAAVTADGAARCFEWPEDVRDDAHGRSLIVQLVDDGHLIAEPRAGPCGPPPYRAGVGAVRFER